MRHRLDTLRCRGVKGRRHAGELPHPVPGDGRQGARARTAGGAADRSRELPGHGQTYRASRTARSCRPWRHRRECPNTHRPPLLQGVGELAGRSTASRWAPRRWPTSATRCAPRHVRHRRRLLTTPERPAQRRHPWLERSLAIGEPPPGDPRRLPLRDAHPRLAAHVGAGLVCGGRGRRPRAREIPFMATETMIMESALRGANAACTRRSASTAWRRRPRSSRAAPNR